MEKETVFEIEKNGKKLNSFNSYQEAFRVTCELIQKEFPVFKYIRKSQFSNDEFKKIEKYYVNDGLYKETEKVFGFGSFDFAVEKDSYSIKSN